MKNKIMPEHARLNIDDFDKISSVKIGKNFDYDKLTEILKFFFKT